MGRAHKVAFSSIITGGNFSRCVSLTLKSRYRTVTGDYLVNSTLEPDLQGASQVFGMDVSVGL